MKALRLILSFLLIFYFAFFECMAEDVSAEEDADIEPSRSE